MRCPAIRWVCITVALAVSACDQPAEDEKPQEPGPESSTVGVGPPVEVRLSSEAIARSGIQVGAVAKHTLVPTFRVPARVTFNEEAFAHVGTPVPGRVVELKARLGDVVKKGDALLVVESPELGAAQSDYLQRRTAIAAAESALKPAKLAYERGQALYENQQGIALAEVQKREADFRAAESQLETAQAAVRVAEQKLQTLGMDRPAIEELERYGRLNARHVIHAPISGTV
ncbi:MAG: efflux RND transporter periplasmic adaptor subunit, partial [Planctomycetes bacterium]|nr:efflux RND transporter periplasmic adaptor subunit [Planctomycetota bacterium]